MAYSLLLLNRISSLAQPEPQAMARETGRRPRSWRTEPNTRSTTHTCTGYSGNRRRNWRESQAATTEGPSCGRRC